MGIYQKPRIEVIDSFVPMTGDILPEVSYAPVEPIDELSLDYLDFIGGNGK